MEIETIAEQADVVTDGIAGAFANRIAEYIENEDPNPEDYQRFLMKQTVDFGVQFLVCKAIKEACHKMHPAVEAVLKHFDYHHLPVHLQEVSRPFSQLAMKLVAELPSDPEVTVGLRKLLEAKDCFVRASVKR